MRYDEQILKVDTTFYDRPFNGTCLDSTINLFRPESMALAKIECELMGMLRNGSKRAEDMAVMAGMDVQEVRAILKGLGNGGPVRKLGTGEQERYSLT